MGESGAMEQSVAEEADWRRRRRLASVFGDDLPQTNDNERDSDKSDKAHSSGLGGDEAWYRSNRPPHHG